MIGAPGNSQNGFSGALFVFAFLLGGIAPALAHTADCIVTPSRVVRVGAPVSGLIAQVPVDRGDWIEEGQVIARLDTSLQDMAIQAAQARASNRAELQAAQARASLLRGRLERNRALQARNVVSAAVVQENETELLIAENEVLTARQNILTAEVDLAVAEAERDRRIILSPVTGYVVERALSAGEFWSETTPIMTVADVETLHVEAIVDIEAYGAIRLGEAGWVTPEAPIGGRHEAVVRVIDPVFDAASGTFGVRLALPNPDRLLPAGLRCEVEFAVTPDGG